MEVLLHTYSLCLGDSRGDKTLPGWPPPAVEAGLLPWGLSNCSAWVEVPAGQLLHPGLGRPNPID